jgi:membrane protease YdiL (CAAX protease family)
MKMSNRDLFLFSGVSSFLAFLVLLFFYRESFFYEIFLHLSFLFGAFFLLSIDSKEQNIKKILERIGLPPKDWKQFFLFFALGFLSLIVVLFLISTVLGHFGYADNERVFQKLSSVPFWILPFAVLVAPFTEELFFRAALMPRFGVIGSSLLFGVMHIFYGSVMEVVGAIIIGILLAMAYKKSRTIMVPIAIHLFYNLLSLSLYFLYYRVLL